MSATHEQYVQTVRDIVIRCATARGTIDDEQAERLAHTKLLYGVGSPGVRGVCYYRAWQNGVGQVDVVEIAAMTQESWVQLAGTTIHELAHVLAAGDGHGATWKEAATRLGFMRRPDAAGQRYSLALFVPEVRHAVYELAQAIGDGRPEFATRGFLPQGRKIRPCSAGVGTRGGKSRGPGSGSRMRLYECECQPRPVKVRVASDDFQAHCDRCGAAFTRKI